MQPREALAEIARRCPAYTGDWTRSSTLSDFGGNADDYAREMAAMDAAEIGDIARTALASAPAAEPVSPMAKMAQALRDKAAAEKASFDTRVQSGEWGPAPDAGTEADCQLEHVAQVEGDAVVRTLRWNKNVGAFEYPVGTKLYAASAALASAPAEPVGEVGKMPGTTGFGMAAFKQSEVPLGTKLYTTPQPTAPARAAEATQPAAADPLQGATAWLCAAITDCRTSDIASRLLIGYNRAFRLMEAANADQAPAGVEARVYPLPDDLYPGSKDWLAADYAGRVEWLHTMYEARKQEAAQQGPATLSAIEAAARWVEARRDAYVQEHGSYDPDTGGTDFPGDGAEYVGELDEIAEGLRAAAPLPEPRVDDLAALVARLVRSLRQAAPDNDLPTKALDYLKRHGLQGSPLRAAAPAKSHPLEGRMP